MIDCSPVEVLCTLFRVATEAVQPANILAQHLPPPPKGRTLVIGAGKAAASMAAVVEAHWSGPLTGLVLTRYGHNVPTRRIEVVEAAHPVPDASGEKCARRMLDMVQGLTADDLVLCLISGGASALLSLPAVGVALADKQAVNRMLLKSGATIHEINCVRKHLSAIKGGRLTAACAPASVVSLIISDVPGDDPSVVGSGPTVADPTTFLQAREVLTKYRITPPPAVAQYLKTATDETPKPKDFRLAKTQTTIIATAQDALQAAGREATRLGFTPVILGDTLEGEARDVALVHAAIARQIAGFAQPARPPCVLISGGETTVTVRGDGRGGRNAEFLLALTCSLNGQDRIFALAGDTDGLDGTEDNAAAVMTVDTLKRAATLGLDAKDFLARNDGYGFFHALNDLIITGPTRTNVNDFRAILINS